MVQRTVIWRAPALLDVEEVAGFIAQGDPEEADRFQERVWEAAESLATLSERGRWVPELRHPDYRELLLGDYRLMYRVYSDRVEIAALVHCRRHFPDFRRSRKF